MDEKQINEDRQRRVEAAKAEIEVILRKYELDITAEDMIGEHTKVKIMVQFVDTKKYPAAKLAQEDKPKLSPLSPDSKEIMDDLLDPEGDKIEGETKKKK